MLHHRIFDLIQLHWLNNSAPGQWESCQQYWMTFQCSPYFWHHSPSLCWAVRSLVASIVPTTPSSSKVSFNLFLLNNSVNLIHYIYVKLTTYQEEMQQILPNQIMRPCWDIVALSGWILEGLVLQCQEVPVTARPSTRVTRIWVSRNWASRKLGWLSLVVNASTLEYMTNR